MSWACRLANALPRSPTLARVTLALLAPIVAIAIGAGAPAAQAALPAPGWLISVVSQPTNFSPLRDPECKAAAASEGGIQGQRTTFCDRYMITVRNEGSQPTNGSTVTITDALPTGLKAVHVESGESEGTHGIQNSPLTCELATVSCTNKEALPVNGVFVMVVDVEAAPAATGSVTNTVTVSGGGAPTVSATSRTVVSASPAPFGVDRFTLEPFGLDGNADLQAGDHANLLTTSLQFASIKFPERESNEKEEPPKYLPAQDVKDIVVELPPGFVGDPLATPQCPQYLVHNSACPAASRVGTIGISTEKTGASGVEEEPVFNVVPEHGYPAEFGFEFLAREFVMYASVVKTPSGYRLRVTVPGLPRASHSLQITGVTLTFFGDPAVSDGGAFAPTAFLANPTDCSAGPLNARVEVDSWQNPGAFVSKETTTYPHISGCNLLQFQPTIGVQPETTVADEPSGYSVDLRVPQPPNISPALTTADLRDAKIALPEGVSVSPSAADGLAGCRENGPEGIDMPNGGLAPNQAGEGEAIGADGLSHLTAGHCPPASTVASVEITTPLLAEPLRGHLFLAQPKCGGESQPACTEASATNGELFGLYLEVEGSGAVIKLKGQTSADPVTGRLTATFKENPQLPFSELKVQLKGGPRAPLANPQTCGPAQTVTDLIPWGTPEVPDATPSSSFEVSCPGLGAFAPSFSAGTLTPTAGAFSPFTVTLSRHDREQDLSGVSVVMPPGLLGLLSRVALCAEPQAASGTCGPQSLVGHTTVAAGAGSQPFYVTGTVYLTGPYRGAPFGLSIVVPAKAGPFNLGNVIVRAAVGVDPHTAQIIATSDPLPQIIDGVPLRVQKITVTTDRPGFMFNPTNCVQQQVTATIAAIQGATANVTSPFAAGGCASLPFKPSFTASTQAKTSKLNGASLDVKISAPGQGPQTNPAVVPEANIKKVDVQLPLALPSRLTTLQKACVAEQFEANPAGCPAASVVGTAIANTPVLPAPLEGPAYLVSHAAAAFPDLVIVLQGNGVVIDLTGNTLIRKGITYSKFDTTPDAPISSFELKLPEGPHSALAAYGNLCAQTKTVTVRRRVTLRLGGRVRHVLRSVKVRTAESLRMPTTITFQNGGVMQQDTPISVTGCAKAHRTGKTSNRHSTGKRR
jgi:hypothetical protein